MEKILRILRALTFMWTGINVNRIVDTINVPRDSRERGGSRESEEIMPRTM